MKDNFFRRRTAKYDVIAINSEFGIVELETGEMIVQFALPDGCADALIEAIQTSESWKTTARSSKTAPEPAQEKAPTPEKKKSTRKKSA